MRVSKRASTRARGRERTFFFAIAAAVLDEVEHAQHAPQHEREVLGVDARHGLRVGAGLDAAGARARGRRAVVRDAPHGGVARRVDAGGDAHDARGD